MQSNRTAPPAFVIFAIVGGLLFILGGVATAMSSNARAVMGAAAVAFLALGIYTVVIVIRHNRVAERNEDLESWVSDREIADAGLRVRLGYMLREPLTTALELTDRLMAEFDLSMDERMAILGEVRTTVHEVETVLADLAAENDVVDSHPRMLRVVPVDEEVRSVTSTVDRAIRVEVDLGGPKAIADPAHLRQILRTVLAVIEPTTGDVVVRTERRANTATVTIATRDRMLSDEAVAALTGNTELGDHTDPRFLALMTAQELAIDMDGSIAYTEAMGRSHVMVSLPAADESPGLRPPTERARTSAHGATDGESHGPDLSFATTVDLRPERPTAGMRFN